MSCETSARDRGRGLPLRWICTLSAGLLLAGAAPAYANEPPELWREQLSEHFQIVFSSDDAFASEVLTAAERYYRQINADLGFDRVVKQEHLTFWTWESRCRIELFQDGAAYRKSTGAPAWSGGRVNYERRVIQSYEASGAFLSSVLPHEMAHILLREVVGFDNQVLPRWLEEGVAQYAEDGRRARAVDLVARRVAEGSALPIRILADYNPRHFDTLQARHYYAQAACLVHFLIAEYGSERFLDLLRNLRDGYPFERALSFATGGRLGTLEELDTASRQFLLASAPAAAAEEAASPALAFYAGKPMPDLAVFSVESGTRWLLRFMNKVSLVYIWRPSCEPCSEELGQVNELFNELRSRGLQVAGLTPPDDPLILERRRELWVDEGHLYPEFVAEHPFQVYAENGEEVRLSGSEAILVLVGRDNRVRRIWTGTFGLVRGELLREVDTLLKKGRP